MFLIGGGKHFNYPHFVIFQWVLVTRSCWEKNHQACSLHNFSTEIPVLLLERVIYWKTAGGWGEFNYSSALWFWKMLFVFDYFPACFYNLLLSLFFFSLPHAMAFFSTFLRVAISCSFADFHILLRSVSSWAMLSAISAAAGDSVPRRNGNAGLTRPIIVRKNPLPLWYDIGLTKRSMSC